MLRYAGWFFLATAFSSAASAAEVGQPDVAFLHTVSSSHWDTAKPEGSIAVPKICLQRWP